MQKIMKNPTSDVWDFPRRPMHKPGARRSRWNSNWRRSTAFAAARPAEMTEEFHGKGPMRNGICFMGNSTGITGIFVWDIRMGCPWKRFLNNAWCLVEKKPGFSTQEKSSFGDHRSTPTQKSMVRIHQATEKCPSHSNPIPSQDFVKPPRGNPGISKKNGVPLELRFFLKGLPSGKHTKSYWKWP